MLCLQQFWSRAPGLARRCGPMPATVTRPSLMGVVSSTAPSPSPLHRLGAGRGRRHHLRPLLQQHLFHTGLPNGHHRLHRRRPGRHRQHRRRRDRRLHDRHRVQPGLSGYLAQQWSDVVIGGVLHPGAGLQAHGPALGARVPDKARKQRGRLSAAASCRSSREIRQAGPDPGRDPAAAGDAPSWSKWSGSAVSPTGSIHPLALSSTSSSATRGCWTWVMPLLRDRRLHSRHPRQQPLQHPPQRSGGCRCCWPPSWRRCSGWSGAHRRCALRRSSEVTGRWGSARSCCAWS